MPRKRKKDRKKFRDTKVGAFLKGKFPAILDIADDYLPPLKILTTLVKPSVSIPEVDEIRSDISIPNRVTDALASINLSGGEIGELIEIYKNDFKIGEKWWKSKTVWAAVSIITFTILTLSGIEIPTWIIGVFTALGLLAARFPNKKLNE